MSLNALLFQNRVIEKGQEANLALLASALDAFPVACFMIDTQRRVVHWNRACEILTGATTDAIVGTMNHGQVFYHCDRLVMADLIVLRAANEQIDALYHGKLRPSAIIPGIYEAEDFFPHFGDNGRWLYFSAAPLHDANGRLIGAIETLQDITERRRAEEALRASEEQFRQLSRTDPLTQLFNVRYLYEQLANEITRVERYNQPLSLVIMDVDHFKQVNDRHGHLEGDRVLRLVAEEVNTWKRRSDLAFRYGGDEFAVLMPGTKCSEAETAGKRLVEHWASLPEALPNGTLGCTLSVGVVQFKAEESPQEFIRRADQAAYEAKRLGRNQVIAGSA